MINKNITLLFCICFLSSSCRKSADKHQTEINGQVTQFVTAKPEPNIKVIAIGYYQYNKGLFPPELSKYVDSAITDTNGNYHMQFGAEVYPVDSVVVYCKGKISSHARVLLNGINQQLDLSFSNSLPVIAYHLHIINNDNPPLLLSFAGPDSTVIGARNLDTAIYYSSSNIVVSSTEQKAWVNSFLSGWYYKSGIRQLGIYPEMNIPYADTIHLSETIDVAIFLP